jgi:hypothetical protein
MINSERIEGQEFLHTAGGPTGYLRSAAFPNIIYRETQNTHFIFIKDFRKSCLYEINWKNIVEPAGHRQYNKAHAHCMLDT